MLKHCLAIVNLLKSTFVCVKNKKQIEHAIIYGNAVFTTGGLLIMKVSES